MTVPESQQVSWLSVNELVNAVLDHVNNWPLAGTTAWCSLANDDPRKWAAVLDGGRHHALRMELNQEARSRASKDVQGTADWATIARSVRFREDFYREKPWLKRVAEMTHDELIEHGQAVAMSGEHNPSAEAPVYADLPPSGEEDGKPARRSIAAQIGTRLFATPPFLRVAKDTDEPFGIHNDRPHIAMMLRGGRDRTTY